MEIDEALLTGESRHVQKITSQIIDSDNTCALGDRKNMAYSSTLVTKGRGKGICVKTGLETQVGMIAASISEPKSFFKTIKTPLQVSLDRMMILCFFLALILALVVFGVNNFVFKNETLLYAIGVAVAILPEGLPAVVVVTMAVGVHRMAKQKAIVRKLAALEALGQVTNICSDKTGTLTTGLMTAKHAWLGEKHYSMTGSGIEPIGDLTCNEIKVENVESNPALYYSLLNMALCGTSTLFKDGNIWKATGSPTETAIVVFAAKLKYKKDSLPDFTFLNEFPFDTSIKRMTVCYTRNSETIYFCKGALERVLEVSVNYYKQDGTIIPITDEYRKTAEQELITYAKLGMRVLALAFKTTKENTTLERNQVENNFTFLGIVAVYDPPREESLASVALAHKAGIKVHMATGDHPSTATAISLECGILKQGDDFSKLVYVASDFDKLTDIEIDRLEQLPRVLARCSPQSKVRLVKALHRRKKFVVMVCSFNVDWRRC